MDTLGYLGVGFGGEVTNDYFPTFSVRLVLGRFAYVRLVSSRLSCEDMN